MRRDLVLDLPFFLSLSLSSRCFSIHKGCQVSATSQKSTTKPFNNPEQILGLKKEKPFFFPAVFFFLFSFYVHSDVQTLSLLIPLFSSQLYITVTLSALTLLRSLQGVYLISFRLRSCVTYTTSCEIDRYVIWTFV